jgi:hypothetical protein
MAIDLPAPLLDVTLLAADKPFPDPDKLAVNSDLPDPLVSFLGQPVKSREQWQTERAPELRRLFQHFMYGRMPAKPASFTVKIVHEDKNALGGKATLKDIDVHTTKPELHIQLLVVIPNHRTAPAPAFLGLNFNGNHALLPDPAIRLPESWMPARSKEATNRASNADRGKEAAVWAIEQTIDRGYAFASFYNGDVVPDQADLARERLPQFVSDATPESHDAPATIACWAWGFSRMIDYLVTDPAIDPKRIAVVGHSRNGKTALLAAAMDERIALAIPSQAGCGGTAPNRLPAALQNPPDGKLIHETVKRINTSFPHWFTENFKAFNEATDRLPFDQHCLIALCAPRPVLLSNATEDQWANPAGQFAMLRAADPVYKMVAGDGVGASEMPKVGELLPSRLGYYIRSGKHSMTSADWKVWLDYADQWLKAGRAVGQCCDDPASPTAPRSRTAVLRE